LIPVRRISIFSLLKQNLNNNREGEGGGPIKEMLINWKEESTVPIGNGRYYTYEYFLNEKKEEINMFYDITHSGYNYIYNNLYREPYALQNDSFLDKYP